VTAPALSRHKLSLDEFHRMIEAGIFTPEQRIELLEGELFDMPPIGPAHSSKTNRLTRILVQAVGSKGIVSVQNPIMLGENSEPQPDVTVLRPREDFYEATHPSAEDVLLVVEIADTTMVHDRSYKVPLYARWGIPEAWLIDVTRSQLEIHRQPKQGRYCQIHLAQADEHIALSQLPEVEIALGHIWGYPLKLR
jgi:Uma2 family endonuclease